jgi:transcriptional regulator with XRE-family HTH domain
MAISSAPVTRMAVWVMSMDQPTTRRDQATDASPFWAYLRRFWDNITHDEGSFNRMMSDDAVYSDGPQPTKRRLASDPSAAATSAAGRRHSTAKPGDLASGEAAAPASAPALSGEPLSGEPQSGDARVRANARSLGQLVRSIRISRGMSIEGLAKAAGVSAGGISQIERGVGNPAFTTLMKIADGMQVPAGSFLQSDQEPQGLVVRKEHRKRLVPSEGLIYELLTPDLNRRLEVLRVQIAPGFDNSERPFVHEGEECVHMLEGELFIYIGGDEYHLEEGDSITYDPTVPHWYRNPFPRPTLGFGVITPPGF